MSKESTRKRPAKVQVNNPRYGTAKPQDVGRALLRHAPRPDAGKQAKAASAKVGSFQ